MARAAVPGRLTGKLAWQRARLAGRRPLTGTAAALVLGVRDWPGHRAGQHVDVRLTADDGYSAQRSYSLAAPWNPGTPVLELGVERLSDGEVSGYLVDDLPVGADVEVRGPIGGHFVWTREQRAPLVLVGGGSGLVPLLCMLRERRRAGATVPAVLLLSARSREDVLYAPELDELGRDPATEVAVTLTRSAPPGWTGRTGRVSRAVLAEALPPPGAAPDVYVCGPTPFVEVVAEGLVALGHDPERVRTERFGPTGVAG